MKSRLRYKRYVSSIFVACVFSFTSEAALHDRGGGLIYDDVLNITWLQDANHAVTWGYDSDGFMTWEQAQAWADQLVYGGYGDWRLPKTSQPDSNCSDTYFGGYGYGTGCIAGELGSLFYSSLGGAANYPISSTHNSAYGLFANISDDFYWSGTQFQNASGKAWNFSMANGVQSADYKNEPGRKVWVVRDGDSSPGNRPPSGQNATINVAIGGSYGFDNAGFGFSDPEDGGSLQAVRIDSLPDSGSLRFNQSDIAPGTVLSATDPQAGLHLLVFKAPTYAAAATTSFTFSVRDSAGTYDPSPNTITIHYHSPFYTPYTPSTLTVERIGTGSGAVIGTGIDCGADCTESFVNGAMVTLTASPSPGSTFTGWSGECTPNGPTCQVAMSVAKSIVASFTAINSKTYPVSVTKEGVGAVTSSPLGIDCGEVCHKDFTENTFVTLTAMPPAGSVFTGWSGACSGSLPVCQLTLGAARKVVATFSPNPPANYPLSVSKQGNGSVTSSPIGIECGYDCTESLPRGSVASLTATPEARSRFAGWSGACAGTGATCQVTMSSAKNVTANFTTAPESTLVYLYVSRAWPLNTSQGAATKPPTVATNPAPFDITCSGEQSQICSLRFPLDTVVTLTALPSDDTRFVGWDERCAGWQDTCQLTMSKNMEATASFALEETPDATKPVLRDAIYLYQMNLWGQSEKRLTGHHCDILELVLDVTSGYTDMALVPSVAQGTVTNYPDRLFADDAMFTYTLYSDAHEKRFILRDNQNPASDAQIGQGTFFGYCYSTQPDAYVDVYDQKTNTTYFSDGTMQ